MKNALHIAIAAILYYVFARIGLIFSFQNTNASPFWPASGIAFFYAVRFTPVSIFGVFIGSLLVNLIDFSGNVPLGFFDVTCMSAMIGAGTSVQTVVGYIFWKSFIQRCLFMTPVNSLFFLITACLMCLIGAVVGASALNSYGIIPVSEMPLIFRTWWTGDAVGVMIMFPLLVAYFLKPQKPYVRRVLMLLFIFHAAIIYLSTRTVSGSVDISLYLFYVQAIVFVGATSIIFFISIINENCEYNEKVRAELLQDIARYKMEIKKIRKLAKPSS